MKGNFNPIKELNGSEIFSLITDTEAILIGTNYVVSWYSGKPRWWKIKNGWTVSMGISFQEVFADVNPTIQSQLIYHLDLFK